VIRLIEEGAISPEKSLKYLERLTGKFRQLAKDERDQRLKKYISRTHFFGEVALDLIKKYGFKRGGFVASIYKELMLLEEEKGNYEKALANAQQALALVEAAEEREDLGERSTYIKRSSPPF
jgi:hypothetical protein